MRAWLYQRRFHAQLDCRYCCAGSLAACSSPNDSCRLDQKSSGCWCAVSDIDPAVLVLTNVTSGIVVPQVNTAEEATAVVSYSKFPPQGIRGQGSAFPAITHGIDIPTYLRTANETLITCLQIESKTGVENIDAICAVPGVG